jgi:Flp pilus assembly protein protease CpaA
MPGYIECRFNNRRSRSKTASPFFQTDEIEREEAMACDLFLFGLILAAVADFRTRRIPNSLTYSLVACGLAGAVLRALGVDHSSILGTANSLTLGDSITGLLGCTLVMLVGWTGFGMGGADVKLSAALGANLGLNLGLTSLALAYLSAGLLVIGVLLIRSRWGQRVSHYLVALGGGAIKNQIDFRFSAGLKMEVPMAPFFLLGTFYAMNLERLL